MSYSINFAGTSGSHQVCGAIPPGIYDLVADPDNHFRSCLPTVLTPQAEGPGVRDGLSCVADYVCEYEPCMICLDLFIRGEEWVLTDGIYEWSCHEINWNPAGSNRMILTGGCDVCLDKPYEILVVGSSGVFVSEEMSWPAPLPKRRGMKFGDGEGSSDSCAGWYCCEEDKQVVYLNNCTERAAYVCNSSSESSSSGSSGAPTTCYCDNCYQTTIPPLTDISICSCTPLEGLVTWNFALDSGDTCIWTTPNRELCLELGGGPIFISFLLYYNKVTGVWGIDIGNSFGTVTYQVAAEDFDCDVGGTFDLTTGNAIANCGGFPDTLTVGACDSSSSSSSASPVGCDAYTVNLSGTTMTRTGPMSWSNGAYTLTTDGASNWSVSFPDDGCVWQVSGWGGTGTELDFEKTSGGGDCVDSVVVSCVSESSSSSSTPSACDKCVSPLVYKLTVTATDNSCDCGSYSGVWFLNYTSECTWATDETDACCVGVDSCSIWELDISGGISYSLFFKGSSAASGSGFNCQGLNMVDLSTGSSCFGTATLEPA